MSGLSQSPDLNPRILPSPRLRSKFERSRLHRSFIEVPVFRAPRRAFRRNATHRTPALARRVETIKDTP